MAETKIDTSIAEMLHSDAWAKVMSKFREHKGSWETQLLNNPDLTDGQRKAYIFLRKEISTIFSEIYAMGGTRIDRDLGTPLT